MVRDDKMGTQCALTRLADETFRAIRTTPATAILPGAHKSAAQKRDINRIQIPIASGIIEPIHHGAELFALLLCHGVIAVTHQVAERAKAEIVSASLEECHAHFVLNCLHGSWNVA